MAMTGEQQRQLEAIIEAGVNPQDMIDIAQEVLELKRGTGWGRLEVTIQAGEVDEIETTRRRKPKVERRAK
jgi:hypothetical protein